MISNAQKKALIIGISNYAHLRSLDICKNDGTEMYKVLESLGYEISDKNKLLGEAKGEKVKDAIDDFFSDSKSNLDDTLLFYYSGHGVPDIYGDIYLASSDIDPNEPYRKGFSFEDLTKRIQRTVSTKVVVILDCCYSGSAKLSKGDEESAAKLGMTTMEEKSKKLQGSGKYILSASQALQEAYALKTDEHSIFTYYIIQGLKGNTKSTDKEGNVTPESLGRYAYREIMSLPADKRMLQKPMTKADGSANIILALYPELKPLKVEDIRSSMLNLLREGKVQEFNKMCEEHLSILPTPDFSNENLSRIHIPGANFSSTNLKRTNFSAADLEGANLSNADLTRADLEGAHLYKVNFSNAVLESSNLSNANLTRANLSNANLTRANLSNANIFSGNLQQAKLIGADLRGTNLTEANLIGADLRGAIFEEGRNPIISNNLIHKPVTQTDETTVHKGILGGRTKILVAVLTAAAVIGIILSLNLFFHFNPFSTTTTIASTSSNHSSPTSPPSPPSNSTQLNPGNVTPTIMPDNHNHSSPTSPPSPPSNSTQLNPGNVTPTIMPDNHNHSSPTSPPSPPSNSTQLNPGNVTPTIMPDNHNHSSPTSPPSPPSNSTQLNPGNVTPTIMPDNRIPVPLLPLDNDTNFKRYNYGWNDGAIACSSGQTIPEINLNLPSNNYTKHHSEMYYQGYGAALAHCNIYIVNGTAIGGTNTTSNNPDQQNNLIDHPLSYHEIYMSGQSHGTDACKWTIPKINHYLHSDKYATGHTDLYRQGYEAALAHCNIYIVNGLAIEGTNTTSNPS